MPFALRHEDDYHALYDALITPLHAYNEQQAGPLRSEYIALSAHADDGTRIGGLAAEMYWNACIIRVLWVEPDYRRQGVGRALMQEAERRARQRPCDLLYVSTFDFQGPEFYTAMGFTAFGTLPIPRGGALTWLRKDLT